MKRIRTEILLEALLVNELRCATDRRTQSDTIFRQNELVPSRPHYQKPQDSQYAINNLFCQGYSDLMYHLNHSARPAKTMGGSFTFTFNGQSKATFTL